VTRPTSIAFTGKSGDLDGKQRRIVLDTVLAIQGEPAFFYSGCATGTDIWSAECAIARFERSNHRLMIPQWIPKPNVPPRPCRRDREGMKRLSTFAASLGVHLEYHWCDPGCGDEATGFLRRDDILAVNCTHMIAFPPTAKEAKRSGTWATVRRARKLGRPIKVVPLDGSEGWVEKP